MTQEPPPTVGFDEVMKLIQFKKETNAYSSPDGQFSFPVVEPPVIEPWTKVLVIAPHQDDEVLGCGGTVCQYAHQRGDVKVVYMTDGSFGGRDDTGPELALRRRMEAKAGLLELSCQDAVFLDHPDTGLKCEPETVSEVLTVLDEFRPSKIFVPFYFELHPDHITAGKIVAHALQWYPYPVECYNYEVWTPLFPNVIIDITEVMDTKLNALSKHVSQIQMINYVDKIRGLNAYRSITAGRNTSFCEAFLKCSREQYLLMARYLRVLA